MSSYRIARRLSAAAGVLESFIGVESATDRPVIVKRLVAPWVKEAAAFGPRFAQTLASMKGVDGLPEWLDVGVGRDSLWLVHALAEGESLRTVMNALAQQRGFISPSEGLGVVGALATLLRQLHARELVHGDLSASNVLLTPDGQVLLLDAGVTLSLSPSNQVGPARAEAFTLAPEQLTQTPTKATDLFRLGLLLHELATGTPLFYATDAVQSMVLCQRFMGLARDQVKQVPEPWQTVIIELLGIEPRERPSATDVDATLLLAAQRAGWKSPAEERARLFARACGNRQTLEALARGGTQELVLASLRSSDDLPLDIDVDDTSDEPTTGIFSSLPGTPPTSPTVTPEASAPPSGAVSPGVAVVGRISTRKMSHSELAAARQEQRPTPPTPAVPKVEEPAQDPHAPKDVRIGELLIERGQITREQLLEATEQVQRYGGTLSESLAAIGACDEDAIVLTLADVTRTPHTTSKKLAELSPSPEAMRLVPYELAQQLDLVPLGLKGGTQLLVAMKDPMDGEALERLKQATGLRSIVAMRGGENAIRRTRSRFYTGKEDESPSWLERGSRRSGLRTPVPSSPAVGAGSPVEPPARKTLAPAATTWEWSATAPPPTIASLEGPAGRLVSALLALQGERGQHARTLAEVACGVAKRLDSSVDVERVRFASVSLSIANFIDGRPAWDIPSIASLSAVLGEAGWNAIEPVVGPWLDWPASFPDDAPAKAICIAFSFAGHAGMVRPVGSKLGGALTSFKVRSQLDADGFGALMTELGAS